MDYIAKDWFLEWFSSTQTGVVVISHDRDVLKHVDKIIELKDREIIEYSGNYTDYLRLNSMNANKGVLDFENVQKQIVNTKAKIIHFKRLKEKSRDEGTIKNFLRREQQQRKILAELEEIEKPTFWIDATSQKGLKSEVTDLYQKYKAKNINIDTKIAEVAQGREIMKVESLSLGYGSKILFNNLNFIIKTGDRLQIKGRNGAGKTTLVNHLLAELKSVDGKDELLSTIFSGRITVLNQPKVGIYEQEISLKYMNSTLSEAIEKIYIESGLAVNDEKVRSVMSSYLFNPSEDGKIEVGRLSGGQKARLQLIKMLVNQPDLIILDEPTNHLDLPSIEELENSLKSYSGAILYITHDTYFVNALGGSVIEV
jgi:ATP-binding cassette subfamily F protein 3